jgi:hypothetical protein
MISARRIALLGIGFPLSPVMLAVLGLWPDVPVKKKPLPVDGGGSSGPIRDRKPARPVAAEDGEEARIAGQNSMILALVMAAVTEELI